MGTQTEGSKPDDDIGVKEDTPDSDATILYSYTASDHEQDESSSGSYLDVYDLDPEYDGLPYHSQPVIGGKHGASYTPPGWKHLRVKRRKVQCRDDEESESEHEDEQD